jgi:nicotinamide-nucleotide adenylyltransferase/phosphinothricin biosynthesis protein PhpF
MSAAGVPVASTGAAAHGLAVVTGRFQPFHVQHLELVLLALERAAHVLVGVTNPETEQRRAHPASAHRHLPSANPYTYAQRRTAIEAALRTAGVDASRYSIAPFPLDAPDRWPEIVPPGTPQVVRVYSDWEREKVRRFEAAGYPAIVLQGDEATRVSGTEIRRRIAAGEEWQAWVPPGARERVQSWLD